MSSATCWQVVAANWFQSSLASFDRAFQLLGKSLIPSPLLSNRNWPVIVDLNVDFFFMDSDYGRGLGQLKGSLPTISNRSSISAALSWRTQRSAHVGCASSGLRGR